MSSTELKEIIDKEFKKEDCIVAFLDILGFKEHVNKYLNPKVTQDKEILENILDALNDALKNVKEGENKEIGLVRYKLFSDCVCFSMPTCHGTEDEAAMLCEIVNRVVNYTFHLIRRNIYPRGGISAGFHYQDENIIFSEGLIKAYHLEYKEATYPRTILDERLVERFKLLWEDKNKTILKSGIEKRLIIDEEGITFINPFNHMQSMDNWNLENLKKQKGFRNENDFEAYLKGIDDDFSNKILKNVEDIIEEYKDKEDVVCKFKWLRDLINWNLDPENSEVKFEYLLKSE